LGLSRTVLYKCGLAVLKQQVESSVAYLCDNLVPCDGTVVIRPIQSSDPAGALAPIIRSIGCIRSSRSRLIVLITALYTYLDTITVLIDISISGYTVEAILWTVVLTPFRVLVT
jgi:hypothetical protein